jgi:hypothetical protein
MLLNAKFTPFHQGFKPNSRFQMSQRMSAYGKRVSARRDAQRSSDSSQKRLLIDSLNPHDVVLGRGQHVKHEGNTSFRTLVRSRAAEYHVCCKNSKDLIAREIVRVVEDLGGRFVRRTECSEDASTMVKRSTWELADRSNVLVKVKQTFRDYSVMQRKAASAAASATAWASQSSGTHDSVSTPSLHLAARPNDIFEQLCYRFHSTKHPVHPSKLDCATRSIEHWSFHLDTCKSTPFTTVSWQLHHPSFAIRTCHTECSTTFYWQ